MNYVAMELVNFCISVWVQSGSGTLTPLSVGHLPTVINSYFLLIAIVLVLTVLVHIYLRYTKQGYEISVVGESENTARYIGIKVNSVIVRTMLISGAICGIAGFLIVSALDHTVSAESTVGGLGFTAIMVSWLAKFNPLAMIGTSAFITFLRKGTKNLAIRAAFPDIVVGMVLFFIIGCEFFINYKIKFSHKKSKGGEA
jgi:simple sugar transport system permease protein